MGQKPFDVSDATKMWCTRCEWMVTEKSVEWVGDNPYCPSCYAKLPEPDLAAYDEQQAERAEELQAEKNGAEK